MAVLVRWSGVMTALSSIAHGGETRGTVTMLRREAVVTSAGRLVQVPVISGNAIRRKLRVAGEDLLRGVLRYEGEIGLAAAHTLRNGGSLAKAAGEPLSGARLARVRALVPLFSIFGGAAGGAIHDGCLQVGKGVPHYDETVELLPAEDVTFRLSSFAGTQLERYTRHPDPDQRRMVDLVPLEVGADGLPLLAVDGGESADSGARAGMYLVETFPAGTRFSMWWKLAWATPLEAAFFADVLATLEGQAQIGGRLRSGHGLVRFNLTRAVLAGQDEPFDWRSYLTQRRDEAVDAIRLLT